MAQLVSVQSSVWEVLSSISGDLTSLFQLIVFHWLPFYACHGLDIFQHFLLCRHNQIPENKTKYYYLFSNNWRINENVMLLAQHQKKSEHQDGCCCFSAVVVPKASHSHLFYLSLCMIMNLSLIIEGLPFKMVDQCDFFSN